MFKKKYARVRRVYGKAKKSYRKHSSTSGLLTPLISGAAVGVGSTFLKPYADQYIPSFAGMRPIDEALVIGGGVVKFGLKKDPFHIATAAITVGAAGIAASLVGNTLAPSTSTQAGYL